MGRIEKCFHDRHVDTFPVRWVMGYYGVILIRASIDKLANFMRVFVQNRQVDFCIGPISVRDMPSWCSFICFKMSACID